jgi:hypothetical protein
MKISAGRTAAFIRGGHARFHSRIVALIVAFRPSTRGRTVAFTRASLCRSRHFARRHAHKGSVISNPAQYSALKKAAMRLLVKNCNCPGV